MGLRQHVGILVMMAIVFFLRRAFSRKLKEEFEWYIPLLSALMFWAIGEGIWWTGVFFFG